MDIYALSKAAENAWFQALNDTKPVDARRYLKVHSMLESWVGTETPEQYIEDSLFNAFMLSRYQYRELLWGLNKLGYQRKEE